MGKGKKKKKTSSASSADDGALNADSADDGASPPDSAHGGASIMDSALGGAMDSAHGGASLMDSAHGGAFNMDSAHGGASMRAARAGASLPEYRHRWAGVLNPGPDEETNRICTKIITKRTPTLTKAEDYQGWVPRFMAFLASVCVQGWAIATERTTAVRVYDTDTHMSKNVTADEGGDLRTALAVHKRDVYIPNNRWLYNLIINYLSGPKMRAIWELATRNDG